jgi:hypothetical protein
MVINGSHWKLGSMAVTGPTLFGQHRVLNLNADHVCIVKRLPQNILPPDQSTSLLFYAASACSERIIQHRIGGCVNTTFNMQEDAVVVRTNGNALGQLGIAVWVDRRWMSIYREKSDRHAKTERLNAPPQPSYRGLASGHRPYM